MCDFEPQFRHNRGFAPWAGVVGVCFKRLLTGVGLALFGDDSKRLTKANDVADVDGPNRFGIAPLDSAIARAEGICASGARVVDTLAVEALFDVFACATFLCCDSLERKPHARISSWSARNLRKP